MSWADERIKEDVNSLRSRYRLLQDKILASNEPYLEQLFEDALQTAATNSFNDAMGGGWGTDRKETLPRLEHFVEGYLSCKERYKINT